MYQRFHVATAFEVEAPPGFEMIGFADPTHPQIPVRKDYHFRREILRNILAYLADPLGDGLYLTGPTGAGKTSAMMQVAARLNWPVQAISCHGRLELSDIVGQFGLFRGETRFVHGPLSIAAREGHILLINEVDLADPAELAGLNDIIEGQPLVIAENNEVIRPHPTFRLVVTGNSAGAGDNSGLYQGVMRQNIAFMDRFRVVRVDYPEPDIEQEIVQGAVPRANGEILGKMLEVATEVRRLFTGDSDPDRDAGAPPLTLTMSTRTLVRWAALTVAFKGAPGVLKYALQQALTNRAGAEEREAIHRIAEDVFGDLWWGWPAQQEAQG